MAQTNRVEPKTYKENTLKIKIISKWIQKSNTRTHTARQTHGHTIGDELAAAKGVIKWFVWLPVLLFLIFFSSSSLSRCTSDTHDLCIKKWMCIVHCCVPVHGYGGDFILTDHLLLTKLPTIVNLKKKIVFI